MNKKIKSIINENILYAFRENILIWPLLIYIILLLIFSNVWNQAILNDFKHISYVSIMWNIQYFLWLLLIIYLSFSSFDKDIKTKNIYITLQHVNKKEYFLWKLSSIFLLSWLINLIFLIIFKIGYVFLFQDIKYELFYIFLFQQLDFLVISFIVALISFLLSKNIWRILLVSLFLVLWHMLSYIKALIEKWIMELPIFLEKIVNFLYYIVPNLSTFNVKNVILFNTNLLPTFISSLIYGVFLIFIIYNISMYIFKRKDL